jgi:hypothetical protein
MWTVGKLCAPFGSAKNLAKQGLQKSYYRNHAFLNGFSARVTRAATSAPVHPYIAPGALNHFAIAVSLCSV